MFVEPSPENAVRVLRALESFGFGGLIPDPTELAEPNRVFMLGVKPWRILTSISGVNFDEAWASRVAIDFHGIPIDIIGFDALLKNKRASGRREDHVDVALLGGIDDEG